MRILLNIYPTCFQAGGALNEIEKVPELENELIVIDCSELNGKLTPELKALFVRITMKKLFLIVSLFLAGLMLMSGAAMAVPYRTPQETIGSPALAEDSLQTIVDNVLGAGQINVATQQRDVGLWSSVDLGSTAFTVATFTHNGGELGIYNLSGFEISFGSYSMGPDNVISTDDLTSTSGGSLFSNFSATEYGLWINTTKVDDGDWSTFGFYWDSAITGKTYTQDSKNGGTAEALAYLVENGTEVDIDYYWGDSFGPDTAYGDDDWIIAFDNASNNQDFNDGVFYFKDIQPVPEPATMLLLGVGLIGIGCVGRKKIFQGNNTILKS
jgi:hypothetical protein